MQETKTLELRGLEGLLMDSFYTGLIYPTLLENENKKRQKNKSNVTSQNMRDSVSPLPS